MEEAVSVAEPVPGLSPLRGAVTETWGTWIFASHSSQRRA
jgi:hypothetical protein